MLDKIRLYTRDFQVMKTNHLTLKRHNLDSKGEPVSSAIAYYSHAGMPVEGTGAFNNTGGVNLDIYKGCLFVEFNPSKVLNGHNYFIVSSEELNESIDRIGNHVKNIVGINFNIDKAKLSRIDLCKNIKTESPFNIYRDALDTMIDPRYMPIIDSQTDKGYWKKKNKSRQYVFYDKLQELKNVQKINPESIGINSANIMRAELRFMKASVVRNALETETVNQLRQIEHFHHLEDRYKAIMSKDVFKNDSKTGILSAFDDLRGSLIAVHKWHERDAIVYWAAVNSDLKQYPISFIRRIVESAGIINRQNIDKNMQKIRQLFGATREPTEMRSYESLMDELYGQLVA